MHQHDVFLERAAECERMAEFTRDPGSKATWRRMAERWQRCENVAASDDLAASRHGNETNRRRKPAPAWARHQHIAGI
jgi:hypothetical protein